VRWPYVFVSAYEDGVYVFNMMDPTNPYTVAYYNVFNMPNNMGRENEVYARAPGVPSTSSPAINWAIIAGTWGIDVRNADGLIVASDEQTGFWALKMDGFDGWNGHQWGVPNISSAQDWDHGPEGAPKSTKVS
jgi:hypothetical protein